MKFYHHHNTLIVVLVLAPTGTVGHRTNVHSLFHEVHVEANRPDEHIVPLGHVRHTGDDVPLRGTTQDVQAGLHRQVTLRSASPRRRKVLPDRDDDHGRDEPSHRPATLHPASWEHQHYHQDPSSHNDYSQHDYPSYDQPSTNKWKSWNQWKDYPKPQYRTHPSGWIDYPKASSKHHSYYDSSSKPSTKPLTAFSSDHNPNRSRQPPHRSGSVQSRVSTSAVPPGHVAINLQDGSRDEWARHIKHALNHPREDASSQ